jgi:hypothetical protein
VIGDQYRDRLRGSGRRPVVRVVGRSVVHLDSTCTIARPQRTRRRAFYTLESTS